MYHRSAYFWELFKDSFILFSALHEPPLLFVKVLVELFEHGRLFLHWNVHVILHCVQGPQNKVEDADGRSE